MLNCLKFFSILNFQVMKQFKILIDDKRVFFSEIRDTNELGLLEKKLNILMIPLNVCSYFTVTCSVCFWYIES